eukprot:401340-Rhodomonas_salina.1
MRLMSPVASNNASFTTNVLSVPLSSLMGKCKLVGKVGSAWMCCVSSYYAPGTPGLQARLPV